MTCPAIKTLSLSEFTTPCAFKLILCFVPKFERAHHVSVNSQKLIKKNIKQLRQVFSLLSNDSKQLKFHLLHLLHFSIKYIILISGLAHTDRLIITETYKIFWLL